MRLRLFFALTLPILPMGCANLGTYVETGAQITEAAGYTPSQVSNTVKEALSLSVSRAADALSQNGGYGLNRQLRLMLPDDIQQIISVLNKFGLADELSSIESTLNRGAELAAAEAKPYFLDTVSAMSLTNAIGIIRGHKTAATDYFKVQTQAALHQRYTAIMQNQLSKLGYYDDYKQLQKLYSLLPLPNKPSLDFERQAIQKGIDGLFTQIAAEEIKIRENPTEQGSLLLAALLSQ